MSLNVELELLTETHYNRGALITKGGKFDTDPVRAARLIEAGIAKKVGVVEAEAEPEPPAEAEDEAQEGEG